MWYDFDYLDGTLSKDTGNRNSVILNVDPARFHISVTPSAVGQRLDKFLLSQFAQYSRSFLQHLIHEGYITVNDITAKSGQRLKTGDSVQVHLPEPKNSTIRAEPMDLKIVYEDQHILVIDKPAGMVVHPGAGNYSGTLVNGLLAYCSDLSGINGILRPGIVHRLDKNTSGLLVVAKDNQSHLQLASQFENREIKRVYKALVWGSFREKEGVIDTRIGRSRRDRKKMAVSSTKGKQAITTYTVVAEYLYFSLLKLSLQTGRTHQIRVHLQHVHHPVFGDPDYGGRHKQLKQLPEFLRKRTTQLLARMKRQALHAEILTFSHPVRSHILSFQSNLPSDFEFLLKELTALLRD